MCIRDRDGPYWYKGGFNPAAIIALVVAVLPNIAGFAQAAGIVDEVAPIWNTIYTYAWFVGFFIAGGLYLVLMRGQAASSVEPELPSTSPGK